MRVYDGFPSHCTSATYAVFARLVSVLQDNGRIALTAEQIAALSAKSRMPDGATLVDGQGPSRSSTPTAPASPHSSSTPAPA